MTSLVGQDIGRYHVVQQLGQGGMAIVYKAFDTRLERTVALKIIRQDAIRSEDLAQTLKRFEREAKSLAQLDHPFIVKIHDYGEHNGAPYLVMQYISGGTLRPKPGLPMPYPEAARLMAPIARALEYAHQRNIIHRDIKPSNILITDSGEPILTDFGIAKILQAEPSANLTATGVGIGTPEYMAPEQGMAVQVDHRVDIYALGVVFYELVTGQHPYHADTPVAVLLKHMTEPLPRPKQFVPSLPDQVEQIIFKAMAKKPDERYQEMGAFAAALEVLAYQGAVSQDAAPRFMPSPSAMRRPPPPPSQPEVAPPVVRHTDIFPAVPPSGYQVVRSPSQPVVKPVVPAASPQAVAPPAPPPVAVAPARKSGGWVIWAGLGALAVGAFLCILFVVGMGGLISPGQPTLVPATKSPDSKITGQVTTGPIVQTADKSTEAFNSGKVRWLDALSTQKYSDEERNQIGKPILFTINLERSEPLLWGTGWCSINKETLYNNMNHVRYQFVVNGSEVNLDKYGVKFQDTRKADAAPCQFVYLSLDQWSQGMHRLVIQTVLDQQISDGWKNFNPGAMIHEFQVTVKEK